MSDIEVLKSLLRGHEPPWTLMEQTLSEFWALTGRPLRAALERTGTPLILRNYTDSGRETFSPGEIDPYSDPNVALAELELLANDGWVEAVGEARFRLSDRAQSNIREAVRAGEDHLEALDMLREADLKELAALLGRLVQASRISGGQPLGGAVVNQGVSALGLIRAQLMELSARRDVAHRQAWLPLDVSGHAWNAFTLIWRGDARNALEVAALQPWRGYAAEDYQSVIADLVLRGWLEADTVAGRYRSTSTGDMLRDEVETRTDAYFYQPWSVLSDAEWDELVTRQTALHARCRELRQAAREAASRSSG